MKKRKTTTRERLHQMVDEIDDAYLPLAEERLDGLMAKTDCDRKVNKKK